MTKDNVKYDLKTGVVFGDRGHGCSQESMV